MANDWMLKHLTAATSIYQTAVDGELLQASASTEGYRRFLARLFGWEHGIELALTEIAGFEWELAGRTKSRIIADDLLALGMAPEEIVALPTCPDATSSITDPTRALGWLFVSERVSFAHGLAYHQLSGSVRKFASSYFDALLTRTAWLEVLRSIDRVCDDEAVVEQLIASATSAFRSKRGWLGTTARSTARVAPHPMNDQVARTKTAKS